MSHANFDRFWLLLPSDLLTQWFFQQREDPNFAINPVGT
jgi:hypothetical protein